MKLLEIKEDGGNEHNNYYDSSRKLLKRLIIYEIQYSENSVSLFSDFLSIFMLSQIF